METGLTMKLQFVNLINMTVLKETSPRGLNAHLNLMNSHLMQALCGATRGMSSIRKAMKNPTGYITIITFVISCDQEHLEVQLEPKVYIHL